MRKYKSDAECSPLRSMRERKPNFVIDDINNSNNLCSSSFISNKIKDVTIKDSNNFQLNLTETNDENKYRYIVRKNCLYDSIDDEEYNDEIIDYYITPNSLFIKIFDILILISSMFSFIFVPYCLSRNFS